MIGKQAIIYHQHKYHDFHPLAIATKAQQEKMCDDNIQFVLLLSLYTGWMWLNNAEISACFTVTNSSPDSP